MSHLPILPILIPFVAAALMLLASNRPRLQAGIGFGAVLLGGAAALALCFDAGTGTIAVYRLGGWPAPFGIVLVADRLAAQMVLLTFALALPALLAGTGRAMPRHFHPLFQLQLAGIAGAFLTGDIFNLFVFFEILLLASYALLVGGNTPRQSRAALAYVILNLAGSALFLVALALIYATLGTLNMADIANRLAGVPPGDVALVRAAFAILITVFLLKAAVLPLAFWLPRTYAAAAPPAAMIFVIMTKVGIVLLLRLSVTIFGNTPTTAGLLLPWLPVLAIATIALGTVGAFAADRLAIVVANLVLVSAGTLVFAVAFADTGAIAALLFYLPHSALVTAGLFLLAALVDQDRGDLGDRLVRGPAVASRTMLGTAFLILAVAVAGLPPLSGFLGKLMLLQSVGTGGWQAAWWAALLGSGLGLTVVLARAASLLFWQQDSATPSAGPTLAGPKLALLVLVIASPAMTLAARPLADWTSATAKQLSDRQAYIAAVLGSDPIARERRP
ncbi:monovalent cation/H+ antiporter subunit D [Polymorphobacter glacialis]|uniref:Monovalent cation/H+ antiporter subunit D n=1 Tax=Sandarakinorhabdus glacialis TaxID=1614636 RepID=A0A917E4N6_9SPHN|nr:monovalent cation/H+ antiporter subunit D [Polymorphobacter glacialis]GGE00506.1 monovalent cation/H+ antiporter subunit D [Polymorphobacter glacialis]